MGNKLFFGAILVVLLATLPGLLDFVLRKEYTQRRGGTVLVTGASTGIGREAVDALLEDGYIVFAGVRKDSDIEKINAVGNPKLKAVKLDVVNQESIDAALETIVSSLPSTKAKGLSAIVLNAGLGGNSPIEFHGEEQARQIYEVNFWGCLKVVKTFLPQLRKDKGRIIFISSLLGKLVSSPLGIYSTSKYAVEGLADGLRLELGPPGVSVSVVEPGIVATPFHNSSKDNYEPTPQAKATYPHLFTEAKQEFSVKAMKKAADASEVSVAIVHAVSSPYPKTRYPVANILGVPSWIFLYIRWATPDRLFDILMS